MRFRSCFLPAPSSGRGRSLHKSAFCAAVGFTFLFLSIPISAQNVSVLTGEYDNARTASNDAERTLNPSNVSPASFGKIGNYDVDGQVVGQPLYVSNVKMGSGKERKNVLYVGTMRNWLYAFDADSPGSRYLWRASLGAYVPAGYAGTCPAQAFTGSELGILSTPVIDAQSGTIYAVAANPGPGQTYFHRLYAFDIATGAPKNGGSVIITASVPGTGTESDPITHTVTLDNVHTIQRPALLLAKGTVYAGFSGCGPDPSPYHGWVVGYSASNVQQQTAVFNSTPNGDEGGIWQSGRGLVSDNQGFVFLETGNGDFDDVTDFGESFVKLTSNGTVADWFTPSDAQQLNNFDLDLSTTSPILMTPDTHLLVGGGKQGTLYVLNASSLGKSGPPVQTFSGTSYCAPTVFSGCQKIHSLAYWHGPRTSFLYTWGTGDILRAFAYQKQRGKFESTPSSQGSETSAYPGGILSVSSFNHEQGTGVLWALTPGELHAFDASNVAIELWNSNQNPARDGLAGNYHFEQFSVVNGRVYVPDAQNHIVVYGLLSSGAQNSAK
jgi:hypothetical protein